MSTFTASKNLELVARGADVGIWDTPTNSNWSIVDASLGNVVSVALTNSNITLSANQYQCNFINFTGAISANIAITLPAVGSFYTIQNLTSNTSAFHITMTTTGGGEAIGIPPGIPCEIMTDGSNVKYRALERVGTYWDYAGSSVPSWVSACTVAPYLNCDGTSFSSATFPILATILGGTTLPDSQGRYRATLNQGSGRITSSAGIDGNTLLAAGGSMLTISASMIPQMGTSISTAYFNDPGHNHLAQSFPTALSGSGQNVATASAGNNRGDINVTQTTNIIIGSSSPATATLPPSYIGGLTLIRAA